MLIVLCRCGWYWIFARAVGVLWRILTATDWYDTPGSYWNILDAGVSDIAGYEG